MVSQTRLDNLRRQVKSQRGTVGRARGAVEDAKKALRRVEKSLSDAKTESSRKTKARAVDSAADKVRRKESDLTSAENELNKRSSRLSGAEGKFGKQQSQEHNNTLRNLETARRRYESQRVLSTNQGEGTVDNFSVPSVSQSKPDWDVFISHASEDKESPVRALAAELGVAGLAVWYDEATLKVGDSLRVKIDEGLASSKFGIVVMSQHFFSKQWTQYELDGLVARQNSDGVKVILPIWHNISRDEVLSYSPSLAGLVALNTAVATISEIATEIASAVRG